MTGEQLAQARELLGLTKPQMAAMLGRKLRNYQQWEAGHRKIDEAAARLIAAYVEGYRPQDWPKGDGNDAT